MNWWGKLLGGAFGFMLGGPIGALIGVMLGHTFDRGVQLVQVGLPPGFRPGETERIQSAFFTTTFSVMGHLAKADGRVSEHEIEMARQIMTRMELTPDMRQAAIRLFNEGKQPGFALDEVLDQFRRECQRRRNLLQMFLEIQLYAVYADGRLHPSEQELLRRIARRLGFTPFELEVLEARIRAQAAHSGAGAGVSQPVRPRLEDAYATLGVKPDTAPAEIKKAYRRLMSQHHPDKLVAKGLPEEMMKLATQKAQEIKAAYDQVREARGF